MGTKKADSSFLLDLSYYARAGKSLYLKGLYKWDVRDFIVHIDQLGKTELEQQRDTLDAAYQQLASAGLKLDLTRGKPGTEQVALSNALDGILDGDFNASDGSDVRNYGGLDGLPEAKALFGPLLDASPAETLIGGNSSLTLMYHVVDFALSEGLRGTASAWGNNDTIKFLCPVPGYDRHFSICEHLGITMLPVPMTDTGPDMDCIEKLVQEDRSIKGIWCVPRFSNPCGTTYSDDTVTRMAKLGTLASEHFLVMWDNAYRIHSLSDDAPEVASIADKAREFGTLDNIFQFGSTSKVTFAGAGVSYLASSEDNIKALKTHLAYQTIGPDKVNQLRHVRFLQNRDNLSAHMDKHATLIKPRFDAMLSILQRELADTGSADWTCPKGGYFISFNTLPGLAKKVVGMASDIGVKLTPAGATFPYGRDPGDANIRLAPTYPSLDDVEKATEAFALCVKLASVQQRLEQI